MGRPDPPAVSSDAERIKELEARIEELERDLAYNRELTREVIATSNAQAADLTRVRGEFRRLSRRRPVRLVVVMATRARRLTSTVRELARVSRRAATSIQRPIRERVRLRRLRASPVAEQALVASIRADPTPPAVDHGPLVSIVIVARGGRAHIERCLRGLVATSYVDVEVIVVVDGSSEASPDPLEGLASPFPLTVQRTRGRRSVSDAAVEGAAIARGALVCFLDDGVEPITERWLTYLVQTITATGAAAVGARLIHRRRRDGSPARARHRELTLRDHGVTFDRAAAVPMPRLLGEGGDPMAPAAVAVGDRPALSGACLLVRRPMLDGVGGLTIDDEGGLSDVDLCLRLRAAGGRLVYDGRAALWYEERTPADAVAEQARDTHDRQTYIDNWGPRVCREALLDALEGGESFSSEPFHVAITVMSHDPDAGFGDWYTGHELGDALQAIGWRVTYLQRVDNGWYDPDPSVEAVVVLLDTCDIRRMPRNLVTMAWVRSWPERWLERPWFDEYDLVFASSARIAALVRQESAKVATLMPIASNADRFGHADANPDLACDVLFVGNYWNQHRGVVDALPALAEHGVSVRVHGRGWDAVPGFSAIDHGYMAYESLPRAYASARIVVDDAAISTKACGSVNSRVFDALAAGAVVVSNGALGVHDLFDDAFPTWSDAPSLIRLVESILGDPDPAAADAARYRAQVLAGHTYPIRSATVRDALAKWASSTRYALRIGVPSWDVTERWGDYHFARALQRSLERAGHPTRLHFLPDWGAPVAAREDVTVHVFGLKEAPIRRGQVNILWQISHPDLATPAMYDRYDHVFVASDAFATRMSTLTQTPVTALHQATDPERFRPDPTGPSHELLFVANSRNVHRRIVDDLARTSHDLAVYGRGWSRELIDPRFVKGEGIPNTDVGRYYSSSAIVLNDHWDDMRERGFISNRLYDALACGAFVISDYIQGVAEEFEGAVVTYRHRDELESLIDRYLADPSDRRRLADLGRRVVVERHTFDLRARVLCATADSLVASRPAKILAGPADRANPTQVAQTS